MLNIEWKSIKGYEGLYEVSNDGRVRRLRFINGKHNFAKIKECTKQLRFAKNSMYIASVILLIISAFLLGLSW